MTGFNSSMNEGVRDLLEASCLRVRLQEVVIERITVVKFGMNNRGGDGRSCFGIEIRVYASELTDMVIAKFGDKGNLVRIFYAGATHVLCSAHSAYSRLMNND